jgi:hypothetical protein
VKHLAALALATGCAHTAPPPPVTAPAPLSPALAPLAFYVGNWKCTATEYDANGAVAKEWPDLGVTVSADYASWLRILVYDHGKQVTSELMGVDDKGHYHHVYTADDGSYGSLTSPGWSGEQLVLDEDHPVPADKSRMTLIKIDDAHYKHTAETDAGKGFKLDVVKSCRRV